MLEPVFAGDDASIEERIGLVLTCGGMLLDAGWKKNTVCVDEYVIANNHRLTFYHTKEEWKNVKDKYVI